MKKRLLKVGTVAKWGYKFFGNFPFPFLYFLIRTLNLEKISVGF